VELNRYVYAMGNPINYADPSGLTVYGDQSLLYNSINIGTKAVGALGTQVVFKAGVRVTFFVLLAIALSLAPSTAVTIPTLPDIPIPDDWIGIGNCDKFIRNLLRILTTMDIAEIIRNNVNFTIWVDGGAVPPPIIDVTNIEMWGGGDFGEMNQDKMYDIFYSNISIAQTSALREYVTNSTYLDDGSFSQDLFPSPAYHTYIKFDVAGMSTGVIDSGFTIRGIDQKIFQRCSVAKII
jgi:hypothetical protein